MEMFGDIKRELDRFVGFSTATMQSLPRDLPASMTQFLVNNQGLWNCLLRAAAVRSESLIGLVKSLKPYHINLNTRLIGEKLEDARFRRRFTVIDPGFTSEKFPQRSAQQVPLGVGLVLTLYKGMDKGRREPKQLRELYELLNLRPACANELVDFHMTNPHAHKDQPHEILGSTGDSDWVGVTGRVNDECPDLRLDWEHLGGASFLCFYKQ